jgi:threonine aldolase
MTNRHTRGFASDNNAGVHPDIMAAIQAANVGHTIAYGDDDYTHAAIDKFKEAFGRDIHVYFVYNGTAANVLSLTASTRSFNAIICAETAHIHVDECGAPEKFSGCKLLSIPTQNGKITPQQIQKHLHGFGFEHHAQPKAISITQPTELGTLYTPEELLDITRLAKEFGLIVHMDGARIANAAAALNVDLKAITKDVGIDLLSFGGTKNGIMFGEAILFFNPALADNFKYVRKQGMQLNSKMRFISVQFQALLTNDLWKKNAKHANEMARILKSEVERIPSIEITQPVQTNAVFAAVPARYIPILQDRFFFYVWNETTSEVRWMTSFDTEEADILAFASLIRKTVDFG